MYEKDGIFNLALFLYDTFRDIMKQEFDQIRSVIANEEDADRIVRLIKNRYQQTWTTVSMAMFRVGLIEPCTCKPKENCQKCQGAQWIMVKGIDYEALRKHADEVLREVLARRNQSNWGE
jgi:ArsR family metal-binding transcriptional regulator